MSENIKFHKNSVLMCILNLFLEFKHINIILASSKLVQINQGIIETIYFYHKA
jgi:hypothetical protein